MRVLVVNDDGIQSDGLIRLARAAKQLGEVWVCAPKKQCSAMSHRITVFDPLEVSPVEFPVEGVKAYSVDGTPADCVKVALHDLLPQKPDLVFSGINFGYNVGIDILYSGTVGAAMEALANKIPAIAFSREMNEGYEVVEAYLDRMIQELMARSIDRNRIWNINFPGCRLSELKGILWDRRPADCQFYMDHFERQEGENGAFCLQPRGKMVDEGAEGTDIHAVLNNYISVGTIRNAIL